MDVNNDGFFEKLKKDEPVVWNEGVPAMLPKQKEGETFIVSYEPKLEAKDEPVATDWERIARVQNAKLMAMLDEAGGFEKLCEVMDKYEALSPTPPQRTWVGLTDEEVADLGRHELWIKQFIRKVEAKLKEKNT